MSELSAPAPLRVAIVNIGRIVSGDWRNPFVAGDTILTEGRRISFVGQCRALIRCARPMWSSTQAVQPQSLG